MGWRLSNLSDFSTLSYLHFASSELRCRHFFVSMPSCPLVIPAHIRYNLFWFSIRTIIFTNWTIGKLSLNSTTSSQHRGPTLVPQRLVLLLRILPAAKFRGSQEGIYPLDQIGLVFVGGGGCFSLPLEAWSCFLTSSEHILTNYLPWLCHVVMCSWCLWFCAFWLVGRFEMAVSWANDCLQI